MVEYYEGFLMAVDSLKRTGTSIDLYTYTTGSATSSLNSILGKSEMKDMDIIFGPLHQQHIKPLADFADKHDIRLVIPITPYSAIRRCTKSTLPNPISIRKCTTILSANSPTPM